MERGLVERHEAYVRSMVEKMVHYGVPDDMSAKRHQPRTS